MKNLQRFTYILLMSIGCFHASQWQDKVLGETDYNSLELLLMNGRSAKISIQQVIVDESFSEEDLIQYFTDFKRKNLPNNHIALLVRNSSGAIGSNAPEEIRDNGVLVANNFRLEHFDSSTRNRFLARTKERIIESYRKN